MDVVSLIHADHRKVEKLFDKYRATDPRDKERKRVVREITTELVRHASGEEEIVYPEAQNLVELPVVADALVAHGEITNCLADLESLDWRSPEYEQTVTHLMQTVQRHVAEEERRILPALRKGMTATALEELAALMAKAKNRSGTQPPKMAKSPKLLIGDTAKTAMKTARKAIDAAASVIVPARTSDTSERARIGKHRSSRRAKTTRGKRRSASRKGGAAAVGKRRTRKTAARGRGERRAR